jgi:hypothetical protein
MLRARLNQLMLLMLLVTSWPTTTRAAITLYADFDSGSLCLAPSAACDDSGAASSVSGNLVTLIGRDNFNDGQWKWFYFRAAGVSGEQVTFEIGDDFNTGASSLSNHRMVYSYDQEHWQFFDQNFRTPAANKFTFRNDAPFTQDEVYVAYGPAYPYQRTLSRVSSIVASPWVSPTASGDDMFVVGQSPGGIDDTGRNITPKNLYGFKITDRGFAGQKKKIVAIGGVHANETLGNFTLDGLVDFLLSDDLAATQLRRYAEFYIYPMANPDGRVAGYNRSTVQIADIDPNRAWNPPSYTEPGDNTVLDDIRQLGQAIRLDTGQDIDYLIDFHSTVNPSIPYHHGLVLPEWQSDPFWMALRGLEPRVLTANAALVDFTGAKFGRDVLNAEFSATFETVFPVNEAVERYLDLGRNFGLAWHAVINVPTDLNFDGIVDAHDWAKFIAGAETNMTGMSPISQYELGDLNGDGRNSLADFVLFKTLFEDANGNGSFADMLASVPEPSAGGLIAVSFGVAGFARIQRWLART